MSLQPQYSLVERSAELDLLPFTRAAGLGVLPWGPLGAGFLSGRYRRGEPPPEGSRMAKAGDDWEEAEHRRATERNFQVVDAAEAIAAEHGATVPQVALAWLLGVEGVTAPILGARTYEHLEDALGCLEVELSAEERARLEAPAPPPVVYPQRMLVEQSGMERVDAAVAPANVNCGWVGQRGSRSRGRNLGGVTDSRPRRTVFCGTPSPATRKAPPTPLPAAVDVHNASRSRSRSPSSFHAPTEARR